MTHFDEISKFCQKWDLEHISLNFVKEHIDEQFLPAFILFKDYRTVLLLFVDNNEVIYVDGIRGWVVTTIEDFYEKSMEFVVLVEPKPGKKDPDFKKNEALYKKEILNRKKSFELRVVDDFMRPEECDQLAQMGESHFKRSTVVSENPTQPIIESEVRTSSSAYLTFKDPFLDELRIRASKLIEVDYRRFEEVQLTTYGKGQHYEIHTDAFVAEHQLTQGQRTHTILVYLTEGYEGGATLFPAIETSVQSKKGRAVIWRSLNDQGEIDFRGYHGGLPVRNGRKTICNLWVKDEKQQNWK